MSIPLGYIGDFLKKFRDLWENSRILLQIKNRGIRAAKVMKKKESKIFGF